LFVPGICFIASWRIKNSGKLPVLPAGMQMIAQSIRSCPAYRIVTNDTTHV
jgi:hypothetical protein